MRHLISIFIGFFLINMLQAQVETQTVNVNSNVYDETKLLYRNEATVGLIITSNGFGFGYRRGWQVTNARRRVFEIEAVTYRHPKEVKITNETTDNPKGYYYGKLNSLLILRPGIGYQNVFFTKPEHNGIEIRWIAFVGASIGFAKPVYLVIIEQIPPTDKEIHVIEKYDPAVHFPDKIFGRAPFMRGVSETKIHPGLYGKFGINFEYGTFDNDIKSIETGVTVDAYLKTIPLMANEYNHRVLISLYIDFNYGGKWF